MDFTKLRGGEDLEVGALRAYRFWRYRFEPMVRLYSFVSEKHWPSGEAVEGGPIGPDVGEQGIHAFKTKRMLLNAVGKRFDGLIKRAGFTHPPSHGIVVGSVEMWGFFGSTPWGIERSMRALSPLSRPTAISLTKPWHDFVRISVLPKKITTERR